MKMRPSWKLVGAIALLSGAAVLAQRAENQRLRERPAMALQPVSQGWAAPPPASPGELRPVRIATHPEAQAENDPVQAVDQFIDRNVKEAEESTRALTREAEALRARLAKVEAALAKWQSVSQALRPAPSAEVTRPEAVPTLGHSTEEGSPSMPAEPAPLPGPQPERTVAPSAPPPPGDPGTPPDHPSPPATVPSAPGEPPSIAPTTPEPPPPALPR